MYALPVAVFLLCGFFLFTWSPSWLDPNVNRLLQVIEPGTTVEVQSLLSYNSPEW